ncbi:MAG: hypothetical protein KJ576_20975 [Proteobacteria bacterium]|nr:hypothetical protein [Pseudomonadota bacterium]
MTPMDLNRAIKYMVEELQALNRIELRKYQLIEAYKIFASILLVRGEEITQLWARQIGKTELGKCIIITCMVLLPSMAVDPHWSRLFPKLIQYKDGFWVGFVAPKLDLARIPFKRIRTALGRSHQGYLARHLRRMRVYIEVSNNSELLLSNGSRAQAMSGSESAFVEGETFHYLHMEEAQELSQFVVYKSLHPMVASTNGTIVKVGTASVKRGSFFESIQFNKRNKPHNHGEYDWRWGCEANDNYRIKVLQERERLGAFSDEFRMAYLLEWLFRYGMLFTPEVWDKMIADGQAGRPHFQRGEFTKGRRKVYGLDLAKVQDATVLTMGEEWDNHIRVIDWVYLEGMDYEDQCDAVASAIKAVGLGSIVVDQTGVGDPVMDMLYRRLPRRSLHGLVYSLSSKDKLMKLGQAESINGRLFYPEGNPLKDPDLRRFHEQCLDCEVERKGNFTVYHHPTGNDRKCHDDFVDSALNMVYAAKEVRDPSSYGGTTY